jgi:hypothetical protein
MSTKTFIAAIAISIVLLSVFGVQSAKVAMANPLPPPVVRIYSPLNNQIYPSGEVWLNFTRLPDTEFVTSITYSLDGKPEIRTNGSTLLSGLSAGSHSLALYAKLSESREDYGFIISKVYFSVNYSTRWATFAGVFSTVVSVGLLVLFFTRHRFVAALRRKKTALFWLGLCLSILGTLGFALNVGSATFDYLFPVYHSGLTVNLTFPSVLFSLFFVGVGLVLAKRGVKTEGGI